MSSASLNDPSIGDFDLELPGGAVESVEVLDSFDSFTRLDAVLSSRHALTGGVIYFPREIKNPTLSTFRPP
jgi:hypothetical protein